MPTGFEHGRRAIASVLVIVAARSDAVGHPALLVRLPDGRRINLRCAGAGSSTVVLESGYEGFSPAWSKVEPIVAETTRVCPYDRAGLGSSNLCPLPGDGAAIAARLAGAFVIVGHSAGGHYAGLFADHRPYDVVGTC